MTVLVERCTCGHAPHPDRPCQARVERVPGFPSTGHPCRCPGHEPEQGGGMNDIDRTAEYGNLEGDDDSWTIEEGCRELLHPYHQDGADGQGGIAGRCFCGARTDYPVGGAA